MNLNELAVEISLWRVSKGFTTSWINMMEKLMLVVTEVSEAAEAYRINDKDHFTEEIADTFIRLLDITGTLEIDIEKAIQKKMEINKTRPYKHGKTCQNVARLCSNHRKFYI